MVAIRGSLIESEQAEVYKNLMAFITKNGGKATYEEAWGKIETAYKMSHETSAYYHVINFEYDGQNLPALETHMQIDTAIIRSLITKIEEEDYIPFTKAQYDESMEAYAAGRQERRKKAAPKTRATTAKQLEEEMKDVKAKKQKTSEQKVDDIINKDLSL